MSEAKINLVETQGFTINFPSIGAPVAIWTEGDEVIVLVSLTLRPRDNVVDVNLDVSTRRDRAAMSGLDEDATSEISRHWRAPLVR